VLKASAGAVACLNTHFAACVNNEQFTYHCSCMNKFRSCDVVMNLEKETPYELCPIHYTHLCVCGACVGAGVPPYTDYARGWTIGVRIRTEETVFSLL
jgi:hypothetical protein